MAQSPRSDRSTYVVIPSSESGLHPWSSVQDIHIRTGGPDCEAASTSALDREAIGGIDQLAAFERQTPTTDAGGEIVPEPFELFDAGIELIPPTLGEFRPVPLPRRSLLGESVERRTDVRE